VGNGGGVREVKGVGGGKLEEEEEEEEEKVNEVDAERDRDEGKGVSRRNRLFQGKLHDLRRTLTRQGGTEVSAF
jgi:TATA-binding protein-associated factor Taf7